MLGSISDFCTGRSGSLGEAEDQRMAQTCSPQLQGSTSLRCVWELQAEQGTLLVL